MHRRFEKADWERYADVYDALDKLRPYSQMLTDVIAVLRTAEYPLLDAGCGTGNLVLKLSKLHTGKVLGIDDSLAMLERAKQKCTDTEFKRADLDGPLPFENGTFGSITCVNALYAVKNPAMTLREFHRVLKPDGLLVLATPKIGYENGLILKAHCRSNKPDSYWLNAHASAVREELLVREAVPDPLLADKLLLVARYNRAIANERSFHFFGTNELERLACERGFAHLQVNETYAGQNLLLIGRRNDERNDRC